MTAAVTSDTIYCHTQNSHKEIEAAFAVKKQYVLGLLPSKGYSAYQGTHTEGKKDTNPPMAQSFVSINMHIEKHLCSCTIGTFVPSAL